MDYSLIYPTLGIETRPFADNGGTRCFKVADYECHERVRDHEFLRQKDYIVETWYQGRHQNEVLFIAIRPDQYDGGPKYIAEYYVPEEFDRIDVSHAVKHGATWKKFYSTHILPDGTCLLRCDIDDAKAFWVGIKIEPDRGHAPIHRLDEFYEHHAEHAKYLTIFDDWTYVLSEAEDDRVEKAATPKATSQVKAMNNISALLPLLLLKHDKANLADNKLLLLAMMSGGSGGDQSNLMQLLMMKELLGEKQNPNPPDGTT